MSKHLIWLQVIIVTIGAVFAQQMKLDCSSAMGWGYCVHTQSPASAKMPTHVFLPGSGARGVGAKEGFGYDGSGKAISQYYNGVKNENAVLLAEKFLTIIIIPPNKSLRHYKPEVVNQVVKDVSAKYAVDQDRISLSGYSMGSRGCWRVSTAFPDLFSALIPSAGGAEDKSADTLKQEPASEDMSLLGKIKDIPVWQFDGSTDNTAGRAVPEQTQKALVAAGSTKSRLTQLQGDHSFMSTGPWKTQDGLIAWLLQQTKNPSSRNDSTPISPSTSLRNSVTSDVSRSSAVSSESSNSISASSQAPESTSSTADSTTSSSSTSKALESAVLPAVSSADIHPGRVTVVITRTTVVPGRLPSITAASTPDISSSAVSSSTPSSSSTSIASDGAKSSSYSSTYLPTSTDQSSSIVTNTASKSISASSLSSNSTFVLSGTVKTAQITILLAALAVGIL